MVTKISGRRARVYKHFKIFSSQHLPSEETQQKSPQTIPTALQNLP